MLLVAAYAEPHRTSETCKQWFAALEDALESYKTNNIIILADLNIALTYENGKPYAYKGKNTWKQKALVNELFTL